MTPLAARAYRDTTDQAYKDWLCQFQWFDCENILQMAFNAAEANRQIGCMSIAEELQLPAPSTWLEFKQQGYTIGCICEERGNSIHVGIIGNIDGEYKTLTNFHMVRGTDVIKTNHDGMRSIIYSALVENLLLIIMQPNLVERIKRNTDKRIVRDIRSRNGGQIGDFLHWSKCIIRSGVHKRVGDCDNSGVEKPLHYVRKFFKPSIGKWIDGYWRGNADIGIHLKWYSIQPNAELIAH